MSARASTSQIAYLPPVAEERFLQSMVENLEQLRTESEAHGRHMLASLLAITKVEAEDDLKTCANRLRMIQREQDHDDGAAMMAQKLAYRADKPAGQSKA